MVNILMTHNGRQIEKITPKEVFLFEKSIVRRRLKLGVSLQESIRGLKYSNEIIETLSAPYTTNEK